MEAAVIMGGLMDRNERPVYCVSGEKSSDAQIEKVGDNSGVLMCDHP